MPGQLSKLGSHSQAITIGAACIATVMVSAISIIFWEWLSGGGSGSATIRNIALVVAAPVGLWLAIWRSRVSERQAKTAQQSLLNERYQKGAEMIGNEVLSVRLGGIYALQHLAEESPEQYHIQIMQLFCASLRSHTNDQNLESDQGKTESVNPLTIRPDIEAIMSAIQSRSDSGIALERESEFRLDLRGSDLRGGQLLDTDLSGAHFHRSNLSEVNFANTDLTDANLFYTDLSRATFRNVRFTRTRLQFTNLSEAMLQNEDLTRADFDGADLSNTNFLLTNLTGATFQHATGTRTWFEKANLSNALFLETDLSNARFTGANLSAATFRGVNMTGVDLAGANLSGTKFYGTPATRRRADSN